MSVAINSNSAYCNACRQTFVPGYSTLRQQTDECVRWANEHDCTDNERATHQQLTLLA